MAPSDFLSAAIPLPGCSGYRQASLPATRRGGAEEDLPISEDNLLAVPSPLRRRAHQCPLPDPRHLPWPSPLHQRLGSLSTDDDAYQASQHPPTTTDGRGDAHTRYGPVSRSTPLRTRPLSHARGCPYPGPGRLLGPDLPWLAVFSSLGYLMSSRCAPSYMGARADGHTVRLPWSDGFGDLF